MRLYAGVFAFLTCVGMASGALAWADQAGSANERPGVQFVSERPVQQWLKGVFERRRPSGEGMVRFDGLWWYGDYRLAMDRANALGRYTIFPRDDSATVPKDSFTMADLERLSAIFGLDA